MAPQRMNPSGFDIPSGTTVYSFILSKISIIGCVRKKFGADVQHLLRMSPNVPLLPFPFTCATSRSKSHLSSEISHGLAQDTDADINGCQMMYPNDPLTLPP